MIGKRPYEKTPLCRTLRFTASLSLAAVNINTASSSELEALPGIGPAKAKAIVDYRQQHGAFKSVEELKNVKGIGEGIFSKLRPKQPSRPHLQTQKLKTPSKSKLTGSIKTRNLRCRLVFCLEENMGGLSQSESKCCKPKRFLIQKDIY